MNISEIELTMMAKNASKNYLEGKVPLNTSVLKVAQDRDLNPHQVARVCEQANLDVYNALWNKVGSGKFTFDLADQDKIAEVISSPSMKLDNDEYGTAPETIKGMLPKDPEVESPSTKKIQEPSAFANPKENKTGSVSRKTMHKVAAHLNCYVSELDAAMFEAKVAQKDAEIQLRDTLKVAALKSENIAAVYMAAMATRPTKKAEIRSLFERILPTLTQHGIDFQKHAKTLSENAMGERSEDLTSVNKNHPVLKLIDTIVNTDNDICRADKVKSYLVKKVQVLNKKIEGTE